MTELRNKKVPQLCHFFVLEGIVHLQALFYDVPEALYVDADGDFGVFGSFFQQALVLLPSSR